MEDVWRRSGHGGVVKEEKRGDSASDEEGRKQEVVVKVGNKSPYHENDNMKPSSPKEKDSKKDSSCDKQVPIVTNLERSSMEPDSIVSSSSRKEQDDQLESARAEMGEAREENQRLKMYLNRIMKDYQTLQTQFHVIVQQESKKSTDTAKSHQEIEESELVSLSLGRFSSDSRKDEKNKSPSQENKADEKNKEGLSLGLDCKFEVSKSEDANEPMPNASSGNSLEESKEEAGETWPPSKILKTMRSGDDDISQQNPTKRARVSVRARCDTPTMNDGCQWRKYGQKIAKGNPCPRAYYRCTIAPSCPVRKQVQRFVDDMSILITTYEGTHNHPLPMSATAMASTTSAAASVLLSGSSSSSLPGSGPLATTTANLDGLNFYLSDNTKSRQFYLPNSSLYSSPSTPTITLDLTSTPSSLSSPFNRFSSNYPPRYDPTSLNFGSSSESNSISWGNGFLSYGTQPHIKNQIGTLNLGRQQPIENIYQSYMQKNPSTPPQQSLPADTIAAATKAITTDPSFQSALAAALTSIIGNGSSGSSANQGGGGGPGGDNFGQKLKWDHETFQVASSYSPTTKGNGCASSYLMSKSSSTSSQPGSLTFLPPSFPFSTSKSASASPVDNREHTN